MLYTSYLAKLNKLPEDMEKVIITRFPPKWLHYRETKNKNILIVIDFPNTIVDKRLSPSTSVLIKYKEDGDWSDYVKKFQNEIITTKLLIEALHETDVKLKENIDICFLCFEKDYLHCHRYLLAQYFMEQGIEWKEWE